MSRVDVISNERVFDDRHHLHEFQDFWRDGPVALVFLPQFGSAFGLTQARELTARFDEVEALGAQMILIGIGTPIQGFTFRNRARSRFPVMATQDHTLYRTMGLASRHRLFDPIRNAKAFITAVQAGVYPYQRTGDPSRLGGVFVVEQGGRQVIWDHRARCAADLASADDVVAALRTAATRQVTTS